MARYSTFSSASLPPGGRENTPMSTSTSTGSWVSLPLPSVETFSACTVRVTAYLPSSRLRASATVARWFQNTIRSNRSRMNGWCSGSVRA